jgi:hypothetical protein
MVFSVADHSPWEAALVATLCIVVLMGTPAGPRWVLLSVCGVLSRGVVPSGVLSCGVVSSGAV